jgi:hypothetical protein
MSELGGPIENKPDTLVSGPAPIFAFEGEDFARLRERVGTDRASWMFAWSPHHLDFNPMGLTFERVVHEVGPYIWVQARRNFAAVTGAAGQSLVPVGDEVHVFQARPLAAYAGLIASTETPPNLDDLTAAFDRIGAGYVVKTQEDLERADPVAAALERWRPPAIDEDEARFFVRATPRAPALFEVVVDLRHRAVEVETLE